MSTTTTTATPTRRGRRQAAPAATVAPPRAPAKTRAAPANATKTPASTITTKTTTPKNKKCDLFRDLYSRCVWFDRDVVCESSLKDVHTVARGFTSHLTSCQCTSQALGKLLLANTYLHEFGVISMSAIFKLDKMMELSETSPAASTSTAPSSSTYKSDFEQVNKPTSKFVAQPLKEPIKSVHLRILIKSAVSSLLCFQQAFEEDSAESPMNRVLICNSFAMDKLNALFTIFTFYGLPQLAFRAANIALQFARRYFLEGKQLGTVSFSKSPDEVLVACANMGSLLLRLGLIDAANAFFRHHFQEMNNFTDADVSMILGYGQAQLFLLYIELNLRLRKYDKIGGLLEAFLKGTYVNQFTIKRYLVKITALNLATRFPSSQYKFSNTFTEFVDPLNMTISVCKRWSLFDRYYPKTLSEKIDQGDPLWIRFTAFNLLLETGRTCVHFHTNSGQLTDAGFFFKLMRNLNVVTLNVLGFASTLLMGVDLDLKNSYLSDAKSKLVQSQELFGLAADMKAFQQRFFSVDGFTASECLPDEGAESPFDHFELGSTSQYIKAFIVDHLTTNTADHLWVLVRKKFELLESGGDGINCTSLHYISLFYLAFQMVTLEQMLSFKEASIVGDKIVRDCQQLLLLLECYTMQGHVPAIKKFLASGGNVAKERMGSASGGRSEETAAGAAAKCLQLMVPPAEQLKTTMEQQLMHGQCAPHFWQVATFYLRRMVFDESGSSSGPLLSQPEALSFLNKLCPIASFSFEGLSARCELFYLRSTVIYRLLKPILQKELQHQKASSLFTVHCNLMLALKTPFSSSASADNPFLETAALRSGRTSKRGGGDGTVKMATTTTKEKCKKALFAEQQPCQQPDLPAIPATGKESLESRRRIIFSEETQLQQQQQQQCVADSVTPCAKKGSGRLFSSSSMTTTALRQRTRPVTDKKSIPMITLDDDDGGDGDGDGDGDDDVLLIEKKILQLSLKSQAATYLAVDSKDTDAIRSTYERMDLNKCASALKDARETAKKVSTYVGLHPSWKLYQEVQYLLFELAHAQGGEGDLQQQQQQQMMMMYHLSEAVDHIAYRYRSIAISSRKAKCCSAKSSSSSYTPDYNLLQFKLADYSSTGYVSYAKLLPKNWRFLQIKLLPNGTSTPDVLFARFQAEKTPLFFKVSVRDFTILDKPFLEEFEEIMADNSTSMMMTERVAYWKKRYEIDERLSALLKSFEDAFIGPFKGMLLGESSSGDYQKACNGFRVALVKAAKKAGLEECTNQALLEVFSESVPFIETEEQLMAGVRFLFGGGGGLFSNLQQEKMAELKRNHFRGWISEGSAVERAKSMEKLAKTFSPLGIILDGAMAQFPLESLPTTRKCHQAMFRVPSIRVASLLYRHRCQKLAASAPASSSSSSSSFGPLTSCRISEQSCYYLVNPANNLANTDKYFRSKFESFVELEPGWEGVIGAEPNLAQMAACFQQKDLFLYFGHGSGSIYYRRMAGAGLDGVQLKSGSLVIGCSSGRVAAESALEGIYGTAYRFLANGAPCYVGALWDITDKDIDLYADQLLSYTVQMWTAPAAAARKEMEHSITRAISKSRDICKLKYLTGAAPVFYGLPMSTAH